MVIRDKQALHRCIKQAVRRAETVETLLDFDVAAGELGIDALWHGASLYDTSPWGDKEKGAMLHPDAAAFYAALDALDLTMYDLNRAQAEIAAYDRGAYLRELLDAMRARRVLVRIPLDKPETAFLGDTRFCALLSVGAAAFVPGRYGVNYERAAEQISVALKGIGAHDVLFERTCMGSCAHRDGEDRRDVLDAVRYTMLPVCEDEGCRLHIGLRGTREVARLADWMDVFPSVKVLAWADGSAESMLIALAKENPRITVRLSRLEILPYAIQALGTRFLAYCARAKQPELMLGRWICMKEKLRPMLEEAYLPLARTGYELTSEMIEHDVQQMLGGCLE